MRSFWHWMVQRLQMQQTKIRFDGFPDFDSSLKVFLPDFEKETGIKVDYLMNNHGDTTKLTLNLATVPGAGDVIVVDVEKNWSIRGFTWPS